MLRMGLLLTFVSIFRCSTNEPALFSGITGKKLLCYEKLLVASFEKIELEEIIVSKIDLRKDQKYLLNIVRAVQKRECDPDLVIRDSDLYSMQVC